MRDNEQLASLSSTKSFHMLSVLPVHTPVHSSPPTHLFTLYPSWLEVYPHEAIKVVLAMSSMRFLTSQSSGLSGRPFWLGRAPRGVSLT